MKNRLAAPALVIASVLAVSASGAGVSARADEPILRVNGQEVMSWQLKLAEDELGADVAGLPDPVRKQLLAQYLVELQLFAQAAKKAELDKTDDFKQLADYYRLRALRDIYFTEKIRDAVTEADAKAIYDEQIGKMEPEEEVRARHILVKTEEEAKKLLKRIADGEDFAELAKKESQGPSAANGGDLGYFTQGRMVKPFADAAFALKIGEVSEPVKTEFGWHVIKVEDRRKREAPKFEDVKDRVMASLIRAKLQETLAKLRQEAKVEILDESLKESDKKESPAADGAAADKAEEKPKEKE